MNLIVTVATITSLWSNPASACLVAQVPGEDGKPGPLARNFEYEVGGLDGMGYIFINPRNRLRSSLNYYNDSGPYSLADNPLAWKSDYSSVTANVIGEHMPQDGMNEKGFAISVTMLRSQIFFQTGTLPDQSTFKDDLQSLPSINELQFPQYLLDKAHDVESAIKLLVEVDAVHDGDKIWHVPNKIRLSKIADLSKPDYRELNLHWVISDADRRVANIWWTGTGWSIRVGSATNDFIVTNEMSEALEILYQQSDGCERRLLSENERSKAAFPRYYNARFYLSQWKTLLSERRLNSRDGAFDFLDETTSNSDPSWSNKWQIVLDPTNFKFHYRTVVNRNLKTLQVDEILMRHLGEPAPVFSTIHSKVSPRFEAADPELRSKNLKLFYAAVGYKGASKQGLKAAREVEKQFAEMENASDLETLRVNIQESDACYHKYSSWDGMEIIWRLGSFQIYYGARCLQFTLSSWLQM